MDNSDVRVRRERGGFTLLSVTSEICVRSESTEGQRFGSVSPREHNEMSDRRDADAGDVLLVEDNPGDVRLTKEALREAPSTTTLHVVNDGESALDFVHQRGSYPEAPRPDLVLLDLNLPKANGDEVLNGIKRHETLCQIPVVILTGSEAEEDIVTSYANHSNAYFTKPIDPDEFITLVRSLEEFWLTLVERPPKPG